MAKYIVRKVKWDWAVFEDDLLIKKYKTKEEAQKLANRINSCNVNLWGIAY